MFELNLYMYLVEDLRWRGLAFIHHEFHETTLKSTVLDHCCLKALTECILGTQHCTLGVMLDIHHGRK